MNAALRKECATLRTLFARATTDEIRTRHRIGRIVLGVQRNVARYGGGAVDRLGVSLRCDRATLYRHAHVARCFAPKRLDEILRAAAARAPSFSWSHLVVLGGVADEGERARLLARALDGLSVRELERAAQHRESVAAPHPSASSVEALRRLCAATELFKGRASVDIDVDVEQPTEEVIGLLDKLAASQDELREVCERNVKALRSARSELVRKLGPGLRPAERLARVPTGPRAVAAAHG